MSGPSTQDCYVQAALREIGSEPVIGSGPAAAQGH